MYIVGLEDILGFSIEKDKLFIDPCIPKDWEGFTIKYRFKNTKYNIEVKNPNKVNKGIKQITADGKSVRVPYIELIDDGLEHLVIVEMNNQ